MMALFLISVFLLSYIVSRYSRYVNIVIATQKKLLAISRKVSEKGVYHANKSTINVLLALIDNVIYNVPNTNMYVTVFYLLKTPTYVEEIKTNFDKTYSKFKNDDLFKETIREVSNIIIEHQKGFHVFELRILNILKSLKSKKDNIDQTLNKARKNTIPAILAYK